MNTNTYTPVIIVGAPRSGTNMLRDLICKLPETATWDCDEINYIWRYGNRSYPSDALTPEHASRAARSYIINAFDNLHARSRASLIVEKTCATSLRIPFVNAILPQAMFISIVRDGRAVFRSALKRWTAPLDLRYIAQKARYVPLTDIPYYAYQYLRNRLSKVAGAEGKLATWGPRFDGMAAFQSTHSFEACVAQQWVECVRCSQTALTEIPSSRRLSLSYEQVLADPLPELQRVAEFLQISATEEQLVAGSRLVRKPATAIGTSPRIPISVLRIMQAELERNGYLHGEQQEAA